MVISKNAFEGCSVLHCLKTPQKCHKTYKKKTILKHKLNKRKTKDRSFEFYGKHYNWEHDKLRNLKLFCCFSCIFINVIIQMYFTRVSAKIIYKVNLNSLVFNIWFYALASCKLEKKQQFWANTKISKVHKIYKNNFSNTFIQIKKNTSIFFIYVIFYNPYFSVKKVNYTQF